MEVESADENKLKESTSTIDFCICAKSVAYVSQMINLMQTLQLEEYRVHVDYTSTKISEQFL